MKLLIASDIHGSAYYCEKLLEAFHREQADRLLLLGDLLYHGPRNDLPRDYQPKAVIAMLNAEAERTLCVRGNCDAEVDQMVLDFPILSELAFLPWQGRMIFATHGHIWNRERSPLRKPGDILLMGHTHVPVCETFGRNGEFTLWNPGSVSLPKEGSAHGYLLLGDTAEWKTLE
ncbi:MAG: phosphodiesterase [Lachnospiraceae bacterium]|nr:phosphodiesterase [Lachnospiraceae bacterium]